jgi:hypothetical protein
MDSIHRWIFILFPDPDVPWSEEPTEEQWLDRCKTLIGDDSLPMRLISISKWAVNEIVAEYYSKGNV